MCERMMSCYVQQNTTLGQSYKVDKPYGFLKGGSCRACVGQCHLYNARDARVTQLTAQIERARLCSCYVGEKRVRSSGRVRNGFAQYGADVKRFAFVERKIDRECIPICYAQLFARVCVDGIA